jgi:hypothetical protein
MSLWWKRRNRCTVGQSNVPLRQCERLRGVRLAILTPTTGPHSKHRSEGPSDLIGAIHVKILCSIGEHSVPRHATCHHRLHELRLYRCRLKYLYCRERIPWNLQLQVYCLPLRTKCPPHHGNGRKIALLVEVHDDANWAHVTPGTGTEQLRGTTIESKHTTRRR